MENRGVCCLCHCIVGSGESVIEGAHEACRDELLHLIDAKGSISDAAELLWLKGFTYIFGPEDFFRVDSGKSFSALKKIAEDILFKIKKYFQRVLNQPFAEFQRPLFEALDKMAEKFSLSKKYYECA